MFYILLVSILVSIEYLRIDELAEPPNQQRCLTKYVTWYERDTADEVSCQRSKVMVNLIGKTCGRIPRNVRRF
ncbi:unnamed protein product [Caenorhabditis bovis]|uniref:DUF19 domain-containing protein n=1 Tax=Caenorhabditis bovis TaxID=2654633 RepID=A0A8S1EA78_9PELO|nr:unnamed protein product [Caenorhabditis bovis]